MPKGLRFLIVGSGAREHALARTYVQSPDIEVIVTPGNKGMMSETINGCEMPICIDANSSLKDPQSILAVARKHRPNYIDVAQDDAIAAGTVDLLQKEGFTVFGPSRAAAQIEWDKAWARDFMARHTIPHPEYQTFDAGDTSSISYAQALVGVDGIAFFKASGLAAGKGVLPVTNADEIRAAFDSMGQSFGEAGKKFLVEKCLRGEEFSYYALTDGRNIKYFRSAQDNKRLLNGDSGPNTGGMGTHSPTLVTKDLETKIRTSIMQPAIEGLAQEGRPYQGILYLGGIVGEDRVPRVIEFNARWGDPEAQSILFSIDPGRGDSYAGAVEKAVTGNVDAVNFAFSSEAFVTIVGASRGYPEAPIKGKKIWVDNHNLPRTVELLSAGITATDGYLYTNGGRVINVIARAETLAQAQQKALAGMACVRFEDNTLHYRTDIAWRDVQRELAKS